MLINVDINFKDNFPAYILRWIPPCGKTADCQQILTVILKFWNLERPCFIQSFQAAKHLIVANEI